MNAEASSCPTIISSLSKSVPMIPRYGHQMCSVLLVGDVAWKTGRNHWGLSSSELGVACRSQIIDLDRYRGSGHRSCTCTVNPKTFLFCFVSRSSFHEFPFFSFFFFSSVVALHAQTLNNVGPLDCKFRLLRRRSLLVFILVAKFRSRRSCTCWLWTFSQRTFVWF